MALSQKSELIYALFSCLGVKIPWSRNSKRDIVIELKSQDNKNGAFTGRRIVVFRLFRQAAIQHKKKGILMSEAKSKKAKILAKSAAERGAMAKAELAKAKEEAREQRVDPLSDVMILDPKEDSVKSLQRFIRGVGGSHGGDYEKIVPGEFADQVLAGLQPESRNKLLRDLIIREVNKRTDNFRKNRDRIDELVADPDSGAYPYVNIYDNSLYEEQLYGLQIELLKVQKYVKETGRKIIILFEGRDAAGKGGTIARFTESLNPRGARVVALPKPTEAEARQWYFQRYSKQLPDPGEMVFFDRSWYNRAVVEPVMGFCTPEQTDLFLREVLFFEKSLVDNGIHLCKLWLDVGRKEQKRRFKVRREDPLRSWKLSPVDLASLEKWDDYSVAIEKMLRQTDAPYAPWTVIRSDDKRRARLNAIRSFLKEIDYPGKDWNVIGRVDGRIVLSASEYMRLHQTYKQ